MYILALFSKLHFLVLEVTCNLITTCGKMTVPYTPYIMKSRSRKRMAFQLSDPLDRFDYLLENNDHCLRSLSRFFIFFLFKFKATHGLGKIPRSEGKCAHSLHTEFLSGLGETTFCRGEDSSFTCPNAV